MGLLDSFSDLNRFKQQRGLFRDTPPMTSAYVLECRLRRKLTEAIQGTAIYDIARDAGLRTIRLRQILEEILPDYDGKVLETALSILERGGPAECFSYLDTIKR